MNWKQTGNTPTGSNAPSPRASLKRKKKKTAGPNSSGLARAQGVPTAACGESGKATRRMGSRRVIVRSV